MATSSLDGESYPVKAFTLKGKADEFIEKFGKARCDCFSAEEEQSLLEMIKIPNHHTSNDLMYITLDAFEVEIED